MSASVASAQAEFTVEVWDAHKDRDDAHCIASMGVTSRLDINHAMTELAAGHPGWVYVCAEGPRGDRLMEATNPAYNSELEAAAAAGWRADAHAATFRI